MPEHPLLPDYYRLLEVRADASPEVIEKAYKALSSKHHPDRRPTGDQGRATRHMQLLNEAYQVLKDPARRSRYDHERRSEFWSVFWDDGLIGLARLLKHRGTGGF